VSRPGARPRGRVLAVTLALVLVPAAALADDLSAEERARRDRAQALADEASALLADYRHDAALAKLDEALEVAPASGALWNSKAWLFFSTGEMEKALEHFEKALELNPTLARAHTGRAMSLFALGRSIGWIGHSIEQYEQDRMIRPRARYTGSLPHDSA